MYSVGALDVLRDLSLTLEGVPPQVKPSASIARDFPPPVVNKFRLAGGATLDVIIITAVSGVVLITMGWLLLTGELTRLNTEAQQALDSLGLNLFGEL